MKRTNPILLLAPVIFLGASFPQPAGWPPFAVVTHAYELVGPGVAYDTWTLAGAGGPLVVHVTTVNLRDPHVALAVSTHGGVIVGADEHLSAIADRAHAEAAVNADYFDINGSGAPLNIVAVGGRVVHQPDGAAAMTIGPGNAITMGPVAFSASLRDAAGATLQINAINDWSTESGLALLTPEFGADAGADLVLVLTPAASGAYRIASATAQTPHVPQLAPGEFGVVARGAEAVGRLAAFTPNDTVTLSFDGTPSPASIVFAAGGGPLLLSGGRAVSDPSPPAPQEANVRYPVTGAGVSADGATLWLVAVDGRSPARSIGITRPMLGALLQAFGAAQAMAFDSGGSTEMVVRHLGDASVSVANTPSDGAERPIADALLVVNTATPGPAAQVLVRANDGAAAVLAGDHLQMRAGAVDANLQPIILAHVAFTSAAPNVASIDPSGLLTAASIGQTAIVAQASGVTSPAVTIDVVASPDRVGITGYSRVVEAGASVKLAAVATMQDGRRVAVDANSVRWSVAGDGRVGGDGSFTGGRVPGTATVTAQIGAASAALPMLVGEHAAPLAALADRAAIAAWTFSASPSTIGGSVDATNAPDNAHAMHLSYDFASGTGTRAAYANSAIKVAGEPLALTIDVYGDSNGEWLRGGYRNADGITDTVTLARHVDWTGWKTLRVAIPPQARWPVVWSKLYVVETRRDAIEAGDLWFRNLNAIEAGPQPAPARFPSPGS